MAKKDEFGREIHDDPVKNNSYGWRPDDNAFVSQNKDVGLGKESSIGYTPTPGAMSPEEVGKAQAAIRGQQLNSWFREFNAARNNYLNSVGWTDQINPNAPAFAPPGGVGAPGPGGAGAGGEAGPPAGPMPAPQGPVGPPAAQGQFAAMLGDALKEPMRF